MPAIYRKVVQYLILAFSDLHLQLGTLTVDHWTPDCVRVSPVTCRHIHKLPSRFPLPLYFLQHFDKKQCSGTEDYTVSKQRLRKRQNHSTTFHQIKT